MPSPAPDAASPSAPASLLTLPPPSNGSSRQRAIDWLRAGGAARLIKYGFGSVVAAVTSAVVFALCYGAWSMSTTPASAVAFIAGAIPNYVLNRRWAWQRRGRVDVWREVVVYTLVSVASFVASAAGTGAADGFARGLTTSSGMHTLIVTGAYVGTYVALFLAKFLCFEVYVFVERPGQEGRRSRRARPSRSDTDSRHQVAAMARANRAP